MNKLTEKDVAEIAALYRSLCDRECRAFYGHGIGHDQEVRYGTSEARLEAIAEAVGKRPLTMSIKHEKVLAVHGVAFTCTEFREEVEE